MGVVVMGALDLVERLLRTRLAGISLGATGHAVGGIGEGLLDLVLSGLGGVRSHLLLSLCSTC